MTRRLFRSLRVNLLLAALAGATVSFIVAGILLYWVFRETVIRNLDDQLKVYQGILIANTELDAEGPAVLRGGIGDPRFDAAYSGWYWQIAPSAALGPEGASAPAAMIRSRSLFDAILLPPGESGGGTRFGFGEGPLGRRLRILEAHVEIPGATQPYAFLVAADAAEVTRQLESFRKSLLLALALFVVMMGLFALVQIRLALRPLRKVGEALQRVRSGTALRLQGEFATELEPVVSELNALLDTNAEVLERARREVGNLAHALKTPLSVLRNEADGAPGALREAALRETALMRRQIDHYLTRARAAGSARVLGMRTELRPRLEGIIRAMTKIYRERNLSFELDCPSGLAFRGEMQDLDEMLGNLLDNASKWAGARVTVSALPASGGFILVAIADDGPGLKEAERSAVLTRGTRLDESVPGSGLGLSIVSDIVALYGGGLELGESASGGLKAVLRIPAAEAPDAR